MAEISKNIRETLKTVNVKKPLLSTLAQKGTDEVSFPSVVLILWFQFPFKKASNLAFHPFIMVDFKFLYRLKNIGNLQGFFLA